LSAIQLYIDPSKPSPQLRLVLSSLWKIIVLYSNDWLDSFDLTFWCIVSFNGKPDIFYKLKALEEKSHKLWSTDTNMGHDIDT
jgi:hypothetical protein